MNVGSLSDASRFLLIRLMQVGTFDTLSNAALDRLRFKGNSLRCWLLKKSFVSIILGRLRGGDGGGGGEGDGGGGGSVVVRV